MVWMSSHAYAKTETSQNIVQTHPIVYVIVMKRVTSSTTRIHTPQHLYFDEHLGLHLPVLKLRGIWSDQRSSGEGDI